MRPKKISSAELARSIEHILGRVLYGRESFIIEQDGEEVALRHPARPVKRRCLKDALRAWIDSGPRDPEWADLLESVDREDRPPEGF